MNDECNKKQEGPKKVNILLHYKYNNICNVLCLFINSNYFSL